jgi:S1-C subfamily serine protease
MDTARSIAAQPLAIKLKERERCTLKDIGVGTRSTNRDGGKVVPDMLKVVFASALILPVASGQLALTTAQIAKRVSPSVVVIQGKTTEGEVLGSGFIVSKDGKIVTNLHVVRDMKIATVLTANGEVFDSVAVLGIDERRDLAVLQITGFDLPVLELGNSDAVTVGEPLVVVGSPRGLEGTVTAGILSSVRDSGDGFKVLQTDAAVNPGNSGGPLVNNRGQVIGVVASKLRSAENLNFAIPINYVRGLMNALHGPITLEQMQSSLSDVKSDQGSVGPSLKETLDWLKEKIPLSAVHYVEDWNGLATPAFSASQNEHATIVSLDSCTCTLDKVSTMIVLNRPQGASSVSTFRYTVPLGALQEVSVALMENSDYGGGIHTIYVSGERWAYRVYLTSKAKDITRELLDQENPFVPLKITTDSLFLKFDDESLANRIVVAFKHAAELCQKREAF